MFYLDHAATTPILPEVLQVAWPYLTEQFGNPSSLHKLGVDAARALKQARQTLAQCLQVAPEGVIFCSGGTEANALAILGIARQPASSAASWFYSALEHPSVKQPFQTLKNQGLDVQELPVTPEGILDLGHAERKLSAQTRLVSCMAVNNEIGTRQPLEELGRLLKQRAPKALLHVDATQAFTKIALPIQTAGIDLLTISGHKFGAPKGIGALVLTRPLTLTALNAGGGQELGLRGGTENVFGAVAMAEAACRACASSEVNVSQMRKYQARWLEFLAKECPEVIVYRSPWALPHYLSLALPPIPAEVFLHHLEAEGILVSTGSACSSKKAQLSPVLQAIQRPRILAQSTIRLSFGPANLLENQTEVFASFERAVRALRELLN